MKGPFTTLCLLTFATVVHSQQPDTIYYNHKWEVCEKPFAEFYRLGTVASDSVFYYKGVVQDFYINGRKQMEGSYNEKGLKDGTFTFYYPNGKLEALGDYRSGLIYGFWNYYYLSGNNREKIYYTGNDASFTIIESFDSTGKAMVKDGTGKFETLLVDLTDYIRYRVVGEFTNGQRTGTWKYFNRRFLEERLEYEEIYDNGALQKRKFNYSVEGDKKQKGIFMMAPLVVKFPVTEAFLVDETRAVAGLKDLRQEVWSDTAYGNTRDSIGAFKDVEIEASYPGGKTLWSSFLMRNLRPDAGLGDVPGNLKVFTQTVWVQFIVCTDGTVCNIQTMNEVLPSLKKEAERVIRVSGKWVPAVKNGRSVKAYRKQPITFQYHNE